VRQTGYSFPLIEKLKAGAAAAAAAPKPAAAAAAPAKGAAKKEPEPEPEEEDDGRPPAPSPFAPRSWLGARFLLCLLRCQLLTQAPSWFAHGIFGRYGHVTL
jgi:hypothetical protein